MCCFVGTALKVETISSLNVLSLEEFGMKWGSCVVSNAQFVGRFNCLGAHRVKSESKLNYQIIKLHVGKKLSK